MKHRNHFRGNGLTWTFLVISLLAVSPLPCVESKTLRQDSDLEDGDSVLSVNERKLDNFVDFTGEGDQLAVESVETGASIKGSIENGKMPATGRQCANVQKAVYPVVPVIIASFIGLIGSIIISAIVRLVVRLMNESDKDGFGDSSGSGYDRRAGRRKFFGFDLNNIDFVNLAKNALSAVEKIY